MLGGQGYRAIGGGDRAGLGVAEGRPALHDLDLGAGEQRGDAAVEAVDDAVLPADGFRQIELRRGDGDPERAAVGDAGKAVRGMDQRL